AARRRRADRSHPVSLEVLSDPARARYSLSGAAREPAQAARDQCRTDSMRRMRDGGFALAGTAAAVIGAGQGIGRATALRLAGAGAAVALVDEVEDRVRAVA